MCLQKLALRFSISYTKLLRKVKNKELEREYFSSYLDNYLNGITFNRSRGDWIALKLNSYSSRHEKNWLRALGLTLLWNLIFFNIYWLSLANSSFSIEFAGWDNIFENIGFFFVFLNPTHKINFLGDGYTLGSSSLIWDSIGRIFIGYGTYQTVAAFRRLGKR